MSTRCNVVITDDCDRELWFYRHSDGYPSGVQETLHKFMKYVQDGLIRDNVSQASGWLIIIGHAEYEYKEPDRGPFNWKVGSYEPTMCMHGDIDYLYWVDLKEKTIKACYHSEIKDQDEWMTSPFMLFDDFLNKEKETE